MACRIFTTSEEQMVRGHDLICEHVSDNDDLYKTVTEVVKVSSQNIRRIHVFHLLNIAKELIADGGVDRQLVQIGTREEINKSKDEVIDLLARLVIHIHSQGNLQSVRAWLTCKA